MVGLVLEEQWPAPLEDWDGAEAVVQGDVAMDPDFRLGVLSLSPALEMPFRTRAAFSSAWVRSSSSLRSWGLSVHAVKAKNHVGVPFHGLRMGPLALQANEGRGSAWRRWAEVYLEKGPFP